MNTDETDGPVTDTAVVEALLRIAKDDADGIVQPEAVVSVAADPASPLHAHFVWDDSEAAHQYRLVQARGLIRRVVITRTPTSAPSFVNVVVRRGDGPQRRGYVQTERAVVDPDLYGQIVADARRGLIAYRNRLSAFEQAHHLVSALDNVIEMTAAQAA